MGLSDAKLERGNQFFSSQETYGPMTLMALGIKNNERWSPLDLIILGMAFVIVRKSHRNQVGFNELHYRFFRIRNCIHLLTADSTGVVEIQQDLFIL